MYFYSLMEHIDYMFLSGFNFLIKLIMYSYSTKSFENQTVCLMTNYFISKKVYLDIFSLKQHLKQ